MDSKNPYHLDIDLFQAGRKELKQVAVKRFFSKTLPDSNFVTDKEETIMDLGCGPGWLTAKTIPSLFPNLKHIFGVDLLPDMIEYAKVHNPHPKVDYSVASIEDWSTMEQWEGQMSKVICIHCFEWVKSQKQCFQNVYKLLKSGGEAAFLFNIHQMSFQGTEEISKDPKWRDYVKDVHNCIPESYFKKYDASHYRKMMEEVGFNIVHIKTETITASFPSDESFRNFFASLCVLIPHIPADRREEFKDDLFQCNLKLNGRNDEGLPVHKATKLELIVKKK